VARSNRDRTLTRTARGYCTELMADGAWGAPDSLLVCDQVIERMAPGVSSAKFHLVSSGRMYAWQWRDLIGQYSRVRVTTDHEEPSERTCVFAGFLDDVDMHFSGRRNDVIVTAVSGAARLNRDTCCYGRTMLYDA